MILSGMGFGHEEINRMMDAAQKVRFAAIFKREVRKRKREGQH